MKKQEQRGLDVIELLGHVSTEMVSFQREDDLCGPPEVSNGTQTMHCESKTNHYLTAAVTRLKDSKHYKGLRILELPKATIYRPVQIHDYIIEIIHKQCSLTDDVFPSLASCLVPPSLVE